MNSGIFDAIVEIKNRYIIVNRDDVHDDESNVRNFTNQKGSQKVISCKLLNLVYVQS